MWHNCLISISGSQLVAASTLLQHAFNFLSNFAFKDWDKLVYTHDDALTVDFLWFGFPAGYEGPVPTTATANHPSATMHLKDLAIYIIKELRHGAMLGPFDHPLFAPWCQVNPLLIRPKKDSS